MSSISSQMQNIIGTINGFQTLVERYPDEKLNLKVIVDWLNNGGQFNCTFDVLALLFSIIGETNLEDKLLEKINLELLNEKAILKVENAIKISLNTVLSTILDCSANPIINDDYFSIVNPYNQERLDLLGVTLNVNAVDVLGKLSTSPLSYLGKYMYSDIYTTGWTAKTKDEIVYDADASNDYNNNPNKWIVTTIDSTTKEYYKKSDIYTIYTNVSGVTSSIVGKNNEELVYLGITRILPHVDYQNIWKTRDMDAWLWYVINKGQNNDKCIWDNRYNGNLVKDSNKLYGIGDYNTEGFFTQAYTDLLNGNKSEATTANIIIDINSSNVTFTTPKKTSTVIKKWSLNNNGKTKVADTINSDWETISQADQCKITIRVTDETYTFKEKAGLFQVKYTGTSSNISSDNINEGFPFTGSDTLKDSNDILLLSKAISVAKSQELKEKLIVNNNKVASRDRIAILKAQYIATNDNGKLWFHIPSEYYFRARSVGDLKMNKFMIEWNRDYLNSIRLFDRNYIIATIKSALLSSPLIGISLNRSQLITNNIIDQIIDNIIRMDDTSADDCYFSFSNEEYDSLLEKADLVRRGLSTPYSEINLDKLYSSLDEISEGAKYNEGSLLTSADSKTTVYANTTADNTATTLAVDSPLVKDLLRKLVKAVAEPFIEPLFSPKVMIIMLMNLGVAGYDISNFSKVWNTLLSNLTNVISSVLITIKDMIVEMLEKYVLDYLTDLMDKVVVQIVLEQVEEYRSVLQHLLDLLTKILKTTKITGYTGIDITRGADILDTSTDPETTKC